MGTTLRALERESLWSNKTELYLVLLKEAVRKDMKEFHAPLAFWDYYVKRRACINNLAARDMFKLHSSNSYTALTGEEGDIFNLCQYGPYEWCYYRGKKIFPFNREVFGRVLGPSRGHGNELSRWI